MRILFIAPYIGATYGGTSKIVTELIQGIGRPGVTVDLVTTDANGSENLDVPLNVWIPEKCYRIQYFNCWHWNDFIFSPSLVSWLANHVIDYELVHTHTIFAPLILFSQWICKFHHIPYIVTPHGMLESWALSYKAWKKQMYYALFENRTLKQSSTIQATASSEVDNIKSLGLNTPIVFIPNGIHCHEFENLPEPEIFYQNFPATRNKTLILFLGRIDPKKGLDLLAPAFAKVHEKFPETHLVIAGPDSIGFLPTVKNYFTQASCLDAVTFTGMLTGELKFAALTAASLYVAPSYSEGFSMSVLEGMASGLTCVITTGCNFPEAAAAQAAHMVDIDADAIANALIQCLSNPQSAKAMGDRARDFICQNYTWEHAAEKLIQVYRAIIDKKPLPKYSTFEVSEPEKLKL
ncbi:MAG: glycosyltransferase [Calothrix sp. MO_167.B42]|nr:glycosyltransferase [Calothrix sp. MO_167.B42]